MEIKMENKKIEITDVNFEEMFPTAEKCGKVTSEALHKEIPPRVLNQLNKLFSQIMDASEYGLSFITTSEPVFTETKKLLKKKGFEIEDFYQESPLTRVKKVSNSKISWNQFVDLSENNIESEE